MLQYRTNFGQPRKPSLSLFGELTAGQARAMAHDWLAEVRRGGGAEAEAHRAPTVEALRMLFPSPGKAGIGHQRACPPDVTRTMVQSVLGEEPHTPLEDAVGATLMGIGCVTTSRTS